MSTIKNIEGEVLIDLPDVIENDFDSIDLSGKSLRRAALPGAMLSDAKLAEADLSEADLYWSNFYRAELTRAKLVRIDARGANFQLTVMASSNLDYANFGEDRLGRGASLHGANLSNASVEGANFVGAEYDERTVFPLGFDPVAHGMILRPVQ